MARTKAQKQEIISKLNTIMDGAPSLVFASFSGLTVAEATEMRKALKKAGVDFFVAKKTLVSKALEAKKYAGSEPSIAGELGLAYGTDLIAPARGVYEFQKKFKEKIAIVGGVFEKAFMDKDAMTAIAAIPDQKTLYGMFVNVINSPIQGLVMALDQIAKKSPAPAEAPAPAPAA
jgi:large subunit ribosomal protein L10